MKIQYGRFLNDKTKKKQFLHLSHVIFALFYCYIFAGVITKKMEKWKKKQEQNLSQSFWNICENFIQKYSTKSIWTSFSIYLILSGGDSTNKFNWIFRLSVFFLLKIAIIKSSMKLFGLAAASDFIVFAESTYRLTGNLK